MQATPRLRELIDGCETITSVVPAHQEEKLAIIADIRERLTDRVVSRLPTAQADRARALREQLAAQRVVTAADAPPVLVDRFRERDGSIGRLAFVRAKPLAKLELDPNLRDFVAGVRNVPVEGQRFDAAGETVVIADLLADIEREGPRTTLVAFVGICLLVMVFFRSASHSAQILTTLTVGVLIMAGVAAAIDLKVNFFNFVVYPITFGIAVDYGANVLARQRARGNVLPSLVEVGPAVILCSWTTIVGYGSLLFSINRALRSFGWYAMLGEFTSILTALMLIPAIALARPALQTQEVKHAP
jgi:predicted RND superfamily exporter protein